MKRIKVVIASAMLMLSCSMAFADDYTVGLKKMFASNALESVDMDAYQKLLKDKSITADQVLDMIVEHTAVYYRENMSLDEFNSMVEFCTNQEYIDVRDRVALGTFITSQAQDVQSVQDSASLVGVTKRAPEFPGGTQALKDYLLANTKYPADALDRCISGLVLVSFVIEKDGSIVEVKPLNNVYPSMDEEAVWVIRNMPKWEPAVLNGQYVRVAFRWPVTFVYKSDAVFRGGEDALNEYISLNVKYPQELLAENIEGEVVLTLDIEADGSVANVEVQKGVHPFFDAEAVRMAQSMPKWSPAVKEGKPVRTQVALPVAFKHPYKPDAAPYNDEGQIWEVVQVYPSFPG